MRGEQCDRNGQHADEQVQVKVVTNTQELGEQNVLPRNKSRKRRNENKDNCKDDERPMKKTRRRWYDIVEQLALQNGLETDTRRLSQRQKQVDFGKNTLAYDKFIKQCPKNKRGRGDPMTPLIQQKCSKRSFAGQVINWRKKVYEYVDKLEQVQIDNQNQSNNKNNNDNSKGKGGGKSTSNSDSSNESNLDLMDFEDNDIQLDDQGNLITNTKKKNGDINNNISELCSSNVKNIKIENEQDKSVFDDF